MKTIHLPAPWTYLTPEVTIDYPAGSHRVDDVIAEAAAAAGATGSKGKSNGDEGTATAGATGDIGAVEGE